MGITFQQSQITENLFKYKETALPIKERVLYFLFFVLNMENSLGQGHLSSQTGGMLMPK
jgi:hypothetical protein